MFYLRFNNLKLIPIKSSTITHSFIQLPTQWPMGQKNLAALTINIAVTIQTENSS